MKIKACKQRNLTISTGEKNVGHYELYSADGINPAPVEVGSLSHHLQGFIHPPDGFLAGFLNHTVSMSILPASHLINSPKPRSTHRAILVVASLVANRNIPINF